MMDVHTLNPAAPQPEHEHAEVVRTTAERIWSAEAAVDAALRETSLLVVQMIDGRVAAGLAAGAVQKAFAEVGATQTGLFGTRASLLRAHTELARVQARLGAGGVKLGGLNKNEHDDAQPVWPWPVGQLSNVVAHPATAA